MSLWWEEEWLLCMNAELTNKGTELERSSCRNRVRSVFGREAMTSGDEEKTRSDQLAVFQRPRLLRGRLRRFRGRSSKSLARLYHQPPLPVFSFFPHNSLVPLVTPRYPSPPFAQHPRTTRTNKPSPLPTSPHDGTHPSHIVTTAARTRTGDNCCH